MKNLSSGTDWVLLHCFVASFLSEKCYCIEKKKAFSLKSKQDLNMEMMFNLKKLVYH